MKIRLCLMTAIFGIAVVAGIIESLSASRDDKEQEGKESPETADTPAG